MNYLINLSKYIMQNNLKLFMSMIIISTIFSNNMQAEKYQKPDLISLGAHYFPIDNPKDASDSAQNIFSDKGAWFGFALPDDKNINSGFVGPYLLHYKNGAWLSKSLINLKPVTKSSNLLVDKESSNVFFDTGELHLHIKYNNGVYIDQTLQYISANSVLINASIHSDIEIETELQWFGELLINETKYEKIVGGFQFSLDNGLIIQAHFSDPHIEFNLSENGYESFATNLINIGKEPYTIQAIISIFQKNDTMDAEIEFVQSVFIDSNRIMVKHKNRWDRYALSISSINKDTPKDVFVSQQSIAVKSILTLINNWRAPYGELKHEGLFPSYARGYFRGFWAWDSWKHAVALAHFEPDVAKNQVRAMYDFQDQYGMIADCVFPDTTIENHNWRDTKPPLSAWAVWSIYEQTKDSSFVAELYFKILKYHEWWYKNRDHNGNGLCEYGSTDGTEIAARWESGMDNAVRFDHIKMVENNESAWSMDQESVDLNSYLFAEKHYLKNMAELLGMAEDVEKYKSEAAQLKKQIQTLMYDPDDGYFYDIRLEDGSFVKVKGPEGWIPLWAGIASRDQAEAVIKKLMDPNIFNTKIPFPTLDASHSEFNPEKGYWRGPVWMDQAYFALMGMKKYGYENEVLKLTSKLFNEIQYPALYENYHPITGEGLNSPHFSWTAAHLYLMYIEILSQN